MRLIVARCEVRYTDRLDTIFLKAAVCSLRVASVISNQNRRDATLAAAYSVRGFPSAPVSTPIMWDELHSVNPQDFTIATVPDRFAQLGDLHAAIDDVAFSLEPLLEWAERDGLADEDEE